MEAKLRQLKEHLAEIADLEAAASVLMWDQQTYMPNGGTAARAQQLATLGRIAHEKFVDPQIGALIDVLQPYGDQLPYDADDAALIRIVAHDYQKATRYPADFIATLYEHTAASYARWAQARPDNDFAAVRDGLERTLEFSRQYAAYSPGYAHIADPLIDSADYGMTVAIIRPLFAELRARLVPLVEAIATQPDPDTSFLHRNYPREPQLALGLEIAQAFGYDLERGRQDITHHPFATRFANGDVRITTRVQENDLSDALFSTLHEAGHAMYEQGVDAALDGTPLASGASAGIHESQSRLWENLVGRSRGFCEYFYPRIQAIFPEQLGDVSLEAFYRAVNRVQRSLIRTDADEVTYNLHVIIRFELELELLEGTLTVRDLPEAWRARYTSDLGITPPDDRDGVLQDVHWFGGLIGGAFQGYTLGNILSAQFYDAAMRSHPNILAEIGQGRFTTLHGWLREHIYRHGRKYTAPELIRRASGGDLTIEPYLAYLTHKYRDVYEL
ncbi:MAG TPA: carboxypeptidase M32 [Roseiflexaceae bacterium]|mgnify:CR=1 FL=1|nr:carboxypeptidase M32 [Roseiflexaceae bacterium]HMP39437.1 carboxypeptidase M32 [Roseiflexaceae bacterium]